MEALHALLYVSRAAPGLTAQDLDAIHDAAQRKNAHCGVTGALLHYDAHFLQLLEGPPQAVRAVYARIAADPRHHDLVMLVEGPTTQRLFGEWSMRRVPSPQRHDRAVGGFLDELRAGPNATAHARTALELLRRLSAAAT